MNNVVSLFGKQNDDVPGTFVGCLLKEEKAEFAEIAAQMGELQEQYNKALDTFNNYMAKVLGRMGADYDHEKDVALIDQETGEVWVADYETIRRGMR